MARQFAGVMGLLAFASVMCRAMLAQDGLMESAAAACGCLAAYAVAGAIVGRLAQFIVDESVRSQLLADIQAKTTTAAGGKQPESVGP